ncbi:MAG TPA: hypothetical protein VMU87_04525 [Stellaceae bacterium]|nr:hypothetical protein [Stellaceae bacterium]
MDKNSQEYPVELLRDWKQKHEDAIKNAFGVPKFNSRLELARAVKELLQVNKAIFEAYGPFSSSRDDPISDAVATWHLKVQSDIIPNNRRIYEFLSRNSEFLTGDERRSAAEFLVHKDALEYNHLGGDKNSKAPTFPEGMKKFFGDCDG